MEQKTKLYLVIPCYNEEKVIGKTAEVLLRKMQQMQEKSLISGGKIVFVNDGSKDKTWSMIEQLHRDNPVFEVVNLSRNRGHQNALLAGLMTVKNYADAVVSMDADLQDDVDVLDEFVGRFQEGYDIVYGVRSTRQKDTYFKKHSAMFFYRLMHMLGVEVVSNHADYRLLSRRVLMELENYREVNLFLRGIVPLVGFESTNVYYERHERFAGESKYPLKKMISFAVDGITSLSSKPIHLISLAGIGIFFFTVIYVFYLMIGHFFFGRAVQGWTSLMVSIWGVGGLELLAIGIIGEYVGKTYLETKSRPRYIVKEYLKEEEEGNEQA